MSCGVQVLGGSLNVKLFIGAGRAADSVSSSGESKSDLSLTY